MKKITLVIYFLFYTVLACAQSVSGTITGTTTVCSGTTASLTLSGYVGTIQWESSANNIVYTAVSGATSATFNPVYDTNITYYRAVVTSPTYPSATTSSISVIFDPSPASLAGTVSGATTICKGVSTMLTLSGNIGTIQWQSSPDNITFTDIAGATTTTYTTNNLDTTTYYKVVVTSGICSSATTATVTVTVDAETSFVSTVAGSTQGYADGLSTVAKFNSPNGIVTNDKGYVYVADYLNNRIRRINNSGSVYNFAGLGTAGSTDGTGGGAKFDGPKGMAIDADGNLYVADYNNHKIRKITPTAVVTTFAGYGGGSSVDGIGNAVRFNFPSAVAVDSGGTVYVSETGSHRIRKITPAGAVTTIAGSSLGFANGIGTAAKFYNPNGLAVDTSGNVYVSDTSNHKIRKITPEGLVTTFAGSSQGFADGAGIAAQFNFPMGLTIDDIGNIYVADSQNHAIRKISPAGVVTTLAGSTLGYTDGEASISKFNYPRALTIGTDGSIYVSDMNNHKIRKISLPTVPGAITGATTVCKGVPNTLTLSGHNGAIQWQSSADNSIFTTIPGITTTTYTASNNTPGITYYRAMVTSSGHCSTISPSTAVTVDTTPTTVAGSLSGSSTFYKGTPSTLTLSGNIGTIQWQSSPDNIMFDDIIGATASTYTITSLDTPTYYRAEVKSGTCGSLFTSSLIIYIENALLVSTVAGSNQGFADGQGAEAQFYKPAGITFDKSGNLYVADWDNHRIRKITPSGLVTTIAGSGIASFADGPDSSANFHRPNGVVIGSEGDIFVADQVNNRIRKITATGIVSTIAGSGIVGFADGTGTDAKFYNPNMLAFDANGNLFVTDGDNHRIRKITPAGVVSTFAGSGYVGSADGQGTSASFGEPYGIVFDASGNLYLSDITYHNIRKITPDGTVSTYAGSGIAGFADGIGSAAKFNIPYGLTIDTAGNIYVSDFNNHRIRKITPGRVVSTFVGLGIKAYEDGLANVAKFNSPDGVTIDTSGNLYVSEYGNNRIRKIAPSFILTFDTNGGSLADPMPVSKGTVISPPTQPTKAGYLFAGWYADAALMVPFEFNSGIVTDTTIYAKWLSNLGINNLEVNNLNFIIFPNPCSDLLKINSLLYDVYNYHLYDMTGKMILTSSNNGLPKSEIDTSGLTRGVYILSLTSEGKTQFVKVVKE